MTQPLQKPPNKDHPITIEPKRARVVVRAGSLVIADTIRALSLKEAAYPAVLYVPRADVDITLLERTELTTHCPYKGDASYFSIPGAGDRAVNIAWSYEAPYEAVAQIAGYVAFYPDRIVSIEEWELGNVQ
jgi:uncharacterized protein (DUF427 family)